MSERRSVRRGFPALPDAGRRPPGGTEHDDVVSVTTDVGPLWIPARDGVMRPYLETYGTWEPDQNAALRALIRPGARFVDVGANVGYVSRLVAGLYPDVRVDAVEPHPEYVRLLDLNTWEFGDRVRIWPLAAGDIRATAGITVAPNNIGDTRTWQSADVFETVVALAPLDQLLTERIDVVKIDVQGYEYEVVCGMQRIIRENPGLSLVVELWPAVLSERGSDPRSVLALYRANAFEICLLRGGAALPASDAEIIGFATSAGRAGQATLLLRRPVR